MSDVLDYDDGVFDSKDPDPYEPTLFEQYLDTVPERQRRIDEARVWLMSRRGTLSGDMFWARMERECESLAPVAALFPQEGEKA